MVYTGSVNLPNGEYHAVTNNLIGSTESNPLKDHGHSAPMLIGPEVCKMFLAGDTFDCSDNKSAEIQWLGGCVVDDHRRPGNFL